MASQIFTQIGTIIDGSYQTQIGQILSKTSGFATATAASGVTIYCLLFALASMMGKVTEPWSDFITRMAKPAAIAAIATTMYATVFNFPGMQTEMVTWVSGTSAYTQMDGLVDTAFTQFSSTVQIAENAFAEGENLGTIAINADQTWTKVQGLADALKFQIEGVVMAVFWYVVAFLYLVAVFILSVAAISIVVIADIFVHIAFAIGPIFVIALMSPYTARLFESWSGFALAQVFKGFLVSIVLILAMAAFTKIIGQMTAANAIASLVPDDPGAIHSIDAAQSKALLQLPSAQIWMDLFALIVMAVVMNRVILEVSGLAGSLAGGFSAQAMSFGQVMALTRSAGAISQIGSRLAGGSNTSGAGAGRSGSDSGHRMRDALEQRISDNAGGGVRGERAIQDARREAGFQTGQGRREGNYNRNLAAAARAMGVPPASAAAAYKAGQVAAATSRVAAQSSRAVARGLMPVALAVARPNASVGADLSRAAAVDTAD